MLLFVFLGLIAKIALVSGDCNLGPPALDDFDISRVCICVLTCFLKQAACLHIEINFCINLYIIFTLQFLTLISKFMLIYELRNGR